jgi:glycosyltransferase involved in cell wall biosynthesis
MKISLIGPVYPYRGGIAHYTTSLAIALKNAGHEVKVISFKRQYPAFLYPGKNDKDSSEKPVRVEAEYLLDPLYPWTWMQTVKEILAAQPDLVLIQWWVTFWGMAFGVLVRFLVKRIKTVYLIHNVLPHENHIWDKVLARFALEPASAFVVQAPSQRERLLSLLPKAQVHFCSHPVYGRFGEQSLSKAEARKQLGLPTDVPIFLFFGIVRPYKGLKHLIKALGRSDESIQLIVAGEFWENATFYEKQIDSLGLAKRVTLLDKYIPNEEAHFIFSAADALIAPYVGGTQSGVVGLAHGYGLPVVMTDIIADDAQGDLSRVRIVPAGDADALAFVMNELAAMLAIKDVSTPPARDNWDSMVNTIERIWSE